MKNFNGYRSLFKTFIHVVVVNGYVLNRQLIITSSKCILTVVQLSVTIVDLCCMDLFIKDFDVAVCVILLLFYKLIYDGLNVTIIEVNELNTLWSK